MYLCNLEKIWQIWIESRINPYPEKLLCPELQDLHLTYNSFSLAETLFSPGELVTYKSIFFDLQTTQVIQDQYALNIPRQNAGSGQESSFFEDDDNLLAKWLYLTVRFDHSTKNCTFLARNGLEF